MEDGVHAGLLHHLAGIKDGHLLTGLGDDAQVVGNHDDRGVVALTKLVHQVQDLGLDGDVQGGGGLIGDEEPGVVDEGDGDHHTLEHAAGKVVGVVHQNLLRTGDFDLSEHLQSSFVHLSFIEIGMEAKRLIDLLPDGVHGVQGGHGFLKDHGDLFTAELAQLRLRERGNLHLRAVLTLKADRTALADGEGVREKAHNGGACDALTAAGLAHHAEILLFANIQVYALHQLHRRLAFASGEVDGHVTQFQ